MEPLGIGKEEQMELDKKQGIYYYKVPGGYCGLGFDVCLEEIKHFKKFLLGTWIDHSLLYKRPKRGGYAAFELHEQLSELCRKENHRTGRRCEDALTPQLKGLEGKRVEVIDKYDEKRRFWVGKSTGWYPVHLEVARSNSTGGGSVIGTPFKQIKVKEGREWRTIFKDKIFPLGGTT